MSPKFYTYLVLIFYLFALAIIGLIIKNAGLSVYYLLALPLLIPAVLLVLFRQDVLIKLVLITAPLIWGFGHINFGEEYGRLNLPILLGVLIILTLGRNLIKPFAEFPLEQIRIAVLVYAIAIIPSVWFATSVVEGIGVYLRILSPLIFMLSVLHYVRSHDEVKGYLTASLFSMLSAVLLLVVAYLTDTILVEFGGELRIGPLGLSPQQLSYYVLMIICPALYLYYYEKRSRFIVIILALFILMYFTKIRTSWVGGVYLLLASMVVLRKQSWLGKVIVFFIIILALVNIGDVIDHFFRYIPFNQIRDLQEWDDVLSGRLSVAQIAISYYLDSSYVHKIFGIGLYRTLEVTKGSSLGTSFGIHGDYLAVLVESGIVGLLAFLLLLFVFIKNLYRLSEWGATSDEKLLSRLGLILFQVFLLMAVPGAWYTNVLGSLYFYFFIGMALVQYKLIANGPSYEA
jgi:O-antigen ligase